MRTETKPVTARIFQSQIDRIDDFIKEDKTYSNRPEFIIVAIREYTQFIEAMLLKLMAEANDLIDKGEVKSLVEISIPELMGLLLPKIYDRKMEGDLGNPILIRMPIGLYENIKNLNNKFKPHKNVQEFIRVAVEVLLDSAKIKSDWRKKIYSVAQTSNKDLLYSKIVNAILEDEINKNATNQKN